MKFYNQNDIESWMTDAATRIPTGDSHKGWQELSEKLANSTDQVNRGRKIFGRLSKTRKLLLVATLTVLLVFTGLFLRVYFQSNRPVIVDKETIASGVSAVKINPQKRMPKSKNRALPIITDAPKDDKIHSVSIPVPIDHTIEIDTVNDDVPFIIW